MLHLTLTFTMVIIMIFGDNHAQILDNFNNIAYILRDTLKMGKKYNLRLI